MAQFQGSKRFVRPCLILLLVLVSAYLLIRRMTPPGDRKFVPETPLEEEVIVEEGLPRIAILIDEIGWDRDAAESLYQIDGNFTISLLPHATYSKEIMNEAIVRNFEVMLPLPIEPYRYPEKGPGEGVRTVGRPR